MNKQHKLFLLEELIDGIKNGDIASIKAVRKLLSELLVEDEKKPCSHGKCRRLAKKDGLCYTHHRSQR